MQKKGTFIISIDCEMLWGMRDFSEKKSLTGEYVLVGHSVMLRILELFKKYDIHATWAFVGLCLLESKDEIYIDCGRSEGGALLSGRAYRH